MGNEVSTTLQLLYVGVFAFLVAGFVEFLDERDRFFTPNIIKITAYEWGIYIGIAFSGTENSLHILYRISYSTLYLAVILQTRFHFLFSIRNARIFIRIQVMSNGSTSNSCNTSYD